MEETIKNPGETTDNTKKAEVVQRHPDHEVLYIGCKDPVAVDLIKSVLGEKFQIFVLNKAIFNEVTEKMIKAHVKWEEEQKILEYTKDPSKMHECLKIAYKVEQKVGAGNWFSLSQFIEETSFTYKHAHSTMDLLFAFGFVAQNTKTNKYMLIADPRIKLEYVKAEKAQLQQDLLKFDSIINQIESGVIEAELAIKAVTDEIEQTKKDADPAFDVAIGEAIIEGGHKVIALVIDRSKQEEEKLVRVVYRKDGLRTTVFVTPENVTEYPAEKPKKKRAPRKPKVELPPGGFRSENQTEEGNQL